jgi:hypothetical protein
VRVPFFRIRNRRGSGSGEAPAVNARESHADAGVAVPADQAASPLPRRRPGSHVEASRVVKVDPAATDVATLRKVLDRLNGL